MVGCDDQMERLFEDLTKSYSGEPKVISVVGIGGKEFSNEALPSEFETIGKRIVGKYHRLPLTIVVVVGFLNSKSAIEEWENVAKDVTSFITNDPDEQCLHILGLSYNHLNDLKACLLYFKTFSEDTEIPVK
ncbi:hypothetical protein BC332_24418 [Capsicum chinense]|nr:hypothetical protein BC332_24418 [Capsicum chinense]